MLIDWFTIAAQIINFLVLMWLLQHFLYQPVLDAIDAREQRIAKQLQQAQAVQDDAEQERVKLKQKHADFDQQQATLLEQATDKAQATHRQLLEDARTEADALRNQWQEALHKEQQALSQSIIHRTRQEVFAITRKTLTDLADAGLEAQMVAVFIRRLQALSEAEKAPLLTADTPILIRSAFALAESEQQTLTQAVQTALALKTPETPLQFVVEPELVSGIELVSGGHKLAWGIADYLDELEASISALPDSKTSKTGGETDGSA